MARERREGKRNSLMSFIVMRIVEARLTLREGCLEGYRVREKRRCLTKPEYVVTSRLL